MLNKDANDMTFFEHLDALRPGLFRSVAVLVVAMLVAFVAKESIMALIMGPQNPSFATNALMAQLAEAMHSEVLRINTTPLSLINTTMAGQFNMHLLLAFYVSLFVAVPYLLFELWLFVLPALERPQRRRSWLLIFYTVLSMVAGALFGYFILAPLSVNFLSNYQVSSAISNMIDARSYIALVSNMVFVSALIFCLPMVVRFLSKIGLVTAAGMRKYRRHAVVALSVCAAVITPPDVMSMMLVLLPLYALYELSIHIASK